MTVIPFPTYERRTAGTLTRGDVVGGNGPVTRKRVTGGRITVWFNERRLVWPTDHPVAVEVQP